MKNEMKKLFTLCLFFISAIGYSVDPVVTLVTPEGLPEPFEVLPGTEVTVQWDYFEAAPTIMLTYDQEPDVSSWQYSLNPEWSQTNNWTDNGDGTFNLTFTVSEEISVWGAFQTSWGSYTYSNVISIGIASPIVISTEDGFICPTGGDTELISVEGTYDGYQWYLNSEMIVDAIEATYAATEAGTYYLVITDADSTIQSNQVIIEALSLAYTGSLNAEGTELTLSADAGMDSYQWYSGPDVDNMTLIDAATAMDYIAVITSDTVYYSVEGLSGTCAIMTDARPVAGAMFVPTVITVNADTNEFNAICEGTIITLSIPESTENYQWYKNGNTTYGTTTISVNSAWKAGDYYVVTIPAEWPDVAVQSETVNASFLEIIQPAVSGVVNNTFHCEGEEITLILVDEGYVYDWYEHEVNNAYGDTDLVDAPNGVYDFTFSDATYITVVANYQGCEKGKQTSLPSYEDESMYISIGNNDQKYLCTDSIADIGLPSYNSGKWESYQWYQLVDTNWVLLDNDTNARYGAAEPGFYRLTGVSVNCETAVVTSNEYQVYHYQERNMSRWASPSEICVGDTSVITFGSYKWENIQWLEGDIVMGSSGYEMIYIPIASDTNKVSVTEYNNYIIKAKHESCPNGLKVTSNPLEITPSVKPFINVLNADSTNDLRWKMALWDSAAFYTFCMGYPVELMVDSGYDSYQWNSLLYAGLDDYAIGDPIEGDTLNTATINAGTQWITLVVEQDGCVGQSAPVMLSEWFFQTPVVQSYNNNNICVDDSALVNLGFPGTWVEYYWMQIDEFGVLDTVPDSNNDSLWVTEPGQYIIFAYPELCPDFEFTSGLGPTLIMFEAEILEGVSDEGDEYFYAYPWQAISAPYEFQWYRNGEPYDNPSEIPAVLWKDDLPGGTYYVEITNPQPCVSVSEGVVWGLGIGEDEMNSLSIYPNPTNGVINIEGLDTEVSSTISIFNSIGKMVLSQQVNSEIERLDMNDLPKGLYIIQVQNKDGLVSSYKINKL